MYLDSRMFLIFLLNWDSLFVTVLDQMDGSVNVCMMRFPLVCVCVCSDQL